MILTILSLLFFASLAMLADKYAAKIKISGVVIAMIGGMLFSNLGIIPSESPLYKAIWDYFIPIAIPILLFSANIKTIRQKTGRFLLAYLFGALGTIIGALLTFYLITAHAEYWKIISALTASYIGGSVNLVSVATSLELHDKSLLSCAIAIDNIMMMIYFIILSLMARSRFLQKYYPIEKPSSLEATLTITDQFNSEKLKKIIMALTIAIIFYLIAIFIAAYLPIQGGVILLVTFFTLILANSAPNFSHSLRIAEPLANFAMMIFFTVIGANSDLSHLFTLAPSIFCIISFLLLFQLAGAFIGGYFAKCSLGQIILACNANAGGPATASAMAASRPEWQALRVPAILCGILGYAIASFIAITLAHGFLLS